MNDVTQESLLRPADEPPIPLGSALGKYRIASVLGRGRLGIVYEAVDTVRHRRVALKLLPEALAHDPPALERFLADAESAARLTHPNLVAVEEIGALENGPPYVALEFIGGSAADQLGTLGRLPWRDATRIVAHAGRGLAAAHESGRAHGGLKPTNLLIAHDGTVKVADLGLTGFGSADTPHYLSPEQCRGEPPDARSDVYSLGATYFTLLTGRTPYGSAGDSAAQVAEAHCRQPVPNVRAGLPTISLRCETIIRKAMAKDPAERYPTAAALLRDLEAVLADADATAVRVPPASLLKPRRPPLWKRLAVWTGGAAATALVLALVYLIFNPRADVGKAKSDRPPAGLETVTNSVGMVLARVPAGMFIMGDPQIPDAVSLHYVKLSQPLLIGTHEVTQEQYQLVTGEYPSATRGNRLPVTQVTWEEAKAFCEKLSARDAEKAAGRVYRLPTEAEWEYCCRAGTRTPFALGPPFDLKRANFRETGLARPTPVGTYLPNAWGLFDMHGNVGEWCADWYGANYYAVSPIIDPTGPREGTRRVVRGGTFDSPIEDCRSGTRIDAFKPEDRSPHVGFRVACTEGAPPK
jgi:formylglycine-generating enzyme required for sulfatase activity